MHVLARKIVGVFAHVQRADENGAGRLQPFDQHGVVRGRSKLTVDLRSCARRQALHVEQVLHCERDAGEGTDGLARRNRRIDLLCAIDRALGRHIGEGVEQRIVPGNARQRVGDDSGRAQASGRDGLRNLGGGQRRAVRL